MTAGAAFPIHLFVYGTLRPGRRAHELVRPYVQAVLPAELAGAALLDLGAYPGLVDGDGWVRGEVLVLGAARLDAIDQYEDCRPDDPTSLFRRREVTVSTGDGAACGCWAYFYAQAGARGVARRCRPQAWRGPDQPIYEW